MVNQREKIQKTSERKSWADLPQDILNLILDKLKLVYAVDTIRFHAICKYWEIPKDEMAKLKSNNDRLPWLCNIEWSKETPGHLECEMYDPYSRQIFKTSKLVESRMQTSSCCNPGIACSGSKQGWMLAGYFDYVLRKYSIFMYNPYRKEYISLSCMHKLPQFGTFSDDLVSRDCRVFVYCRDHTFNGYIASYGLNADVKEWRMEFCTEVVREECRGIQYMNDQLFCLFNNGVMRRYSLVDRSWTSIDLGEGRCQLAVDKQLLWLAKGEGDLLVACELSLDRSKHSTFYFDLSNMSWVRSDLESTAIFVIGRRTFTRPYDVENDKDCKLYIFSVSEKEPSKYTYSEMRKAEACYFSTAFIEPPSIN